MPGRRGSGGTRDSQAARIREASQRRRAHDKEELRRAIMQVAAEVFMEQGYQGFSMRRVAERLGYTVATLYLYFENKDALLFTVLADAFAQFDHDLLAAIGPDALSGSDPASPVIEAPDATDALTRLNTLAQAYVTFGLTHRALYNLMFIERPDLLARQAKEPERSSSMPTEAAPEDAHSVPGYRVLYGAVEAALAAGAFGQREQVEQPDAARRYSDALWARVHGIVALAIRMPDYFTVERAQAAVAATSTLWPSVRATGATPGSAVTG